MVDGGICEALKGLLALKLEADRFAAELCGARQYPEHVPIAIFASATLFPRLLTPSPSVSGIRPLLDAYACSLESQPE